MNRLCVINSQEFLILSLLLCEKEFSKLFFVFYFSSARLFPIFQTEKRKEKRSSRYLNTHVTQILYRVQEITGWFRGFACRVMTGSWRYRNVRVPEVGLSTCATETKRRIEGRGGRRPMVSKVGEETFLTNELNKSIT